MKHDESVVNFFADSHVGLVREENEDSYGYSWHDDAGVGFAVVADGVGGHDRGEVASQLTVQLFLQAWRSYIEEGNFSASSAKKFLNNNIATINKAVYDLNVELDSSMPMGTTVIAAVFVRGKVVIGHIGDSRAYVYRRGSISQLTRDHSYVEELLKNKMISKAESENHPLGHIITRSVGPLATVAMDVDSFSIKSGDRFVICSDGLTNHVSDDQMGSMISSSDTPRTAVKKLVVGALHQGGEDNVTVLGCYV